MDHDSHLKSIMSVEEAADELGIHASTVWRYIRKRKIAARNVGRCTRIKKADFIDYVENLPVTENQQDEGQMDDVPPTKQPAHG